MDSGVVTSRLRSRSVPSPGRMASMHARNQGCRDGPCKSGMERMIGFYFPSPAFYRLMKVREAGTRVLRRRISFRGTNMDEHATDRAPGTRVGQRHFLEPSIADTVRADAGRAAGGPGPLRPAARERRLRRRLRRPSEGQGLALDRGAGPRAAAQPRTPRRLRLRGQHRRRRRDHGPDPGSVPAQGHRPARLHAAREGTLRHRPRLPAARRGAARRSDRPLRGADPRRGSGGPRLARRPDRRFDARRLGAPGPAGRPPDLRRHRRRHRGVRRTRSPSSASST